MEGPSTSASWSPRSLFTWPLHLLVAPLPPLLSFLHSNRIMADWTNVIPAFGMTLVGELAALVLLGIVMRNIRNAAAIVSLATILFYSQHVMRGWEGVAWVLVALLALLLALRRPSGDVITTFANLLASFGLFAPLLTLYGDESRSRHPAPIHDRFDKMHIAAAPLPNAPDVFYIVLDGYGGAGVLSERFGYDSPLPAALQSRGFVVAEDGHSNYIQTALSFAATLNLDYIPALIDTPDTKGKDRGALTELCQDNRMVRTFRSAGYRIVEYSGEYSLTRQSGADERRRPFLYFTEFEYMLVNRTPVQGLTALFGMPQSWLPHLVRRHHLQYTLAGLARGDDNPGPTFTFAHIVAPHPPFIFAADGSYRPERARAAFADGDSWLKLAKPYKESYAEGYIAQVEWLNSQLPSIIDGILSRSPDAVILLQGDHGPGSSLAWRNAKRTDMRERTSILLALRMPGTRSLPISTPVNLFRVVFNELFGAQLPMLPDRSYYSTWDTPYTFLDVTDAAKAPTKP